MKMNMNMNMKMNCLLLLILAIMYTAVASETTTASSPTSESTSTSFTTTTTSVRFSRPSTSDNFLGNLLGWLTMILFLIGIVICTRPKHKYDDNYIVAANSNNVQSTTNLEKIVIYTDDDDLLD